MATAKTSTQTPENTLHIYIRVSTTVQRDEGTSLTTQLEMGRRRADTLGFYSTVWDEGGKSSSHEEVSSRPQLAALYKAIQDGLVRHLYVYDQSRLSRSDGVASAFRYMCNKKGVRLYTKDGEFDLGNSTDRFLTQILDAMAEFENSARMDRALTGRFARARDGLWFGGKSPFGYHIVSKKLLINPKEAKWVRYIFNARADGQSISAIKRHLDKHKIKPRHAKQFSLRSIVVILRNPRYWGNSTLTDSRTNTVLQIESPPIVKKALWDRAQHELDEKLQRSVIDQVRKQKTLLCELAYCGHCGRGISVRISRQTSAPFYHCAFRDRQWNAHGKSLFFHQHKRGCGFDRGSPSADIDQKVVEIVRQAFDSPKPYLRTLQREIVTGGDIPLDHNFRKSLKDQVASLEAEREALSTKNLEQRYWVGTRRRRTAVVRPGETAERHLWVCQRLDALKERLEKSDQIAVFEEWFATTKQRLSDYGSLALREQKDLLGEILAGVELRYVDGANTHSLSINFSRHPMGSVHVSLPPLRRARYVWGRYWWSLIKTST